MIKINY